MSVLFILEGVWLLVSAFVLANSKLGPFAGFLVTIPIIVGAAGVIVGIGLIAKVELIRGITNVFCWIKIVVGVLSAFTGVLWLLSGNVAALGALANNAIDIGSGALMIYLLGETD